jgi:protocatechuate 3,4-dioxygenase beta subunit
LFNAPVLVSEEKLCWEEEEGDPFIITGKVLSSNNQLLDNAQLDVW